MATHQAEVLVTPDMTTEEIGKCYEQLALDALVTALSTKNPVVKRECAAAVRAALPKTRRSKKATRVEGGVAA